MVTLGLGMRILQVLFFYLIQPKHYAGRLDDAGEDQWFYERPNTVIDRIRNVFKRLL